MTKSGKTPDQVRFVVVRPLLPAGFASTAVDKTIDSDSSSSSSGNPFVAILLRGAIMLVLGLVLLPFSLFFRVLLHRWTIQASLGETTMRWRAKSRAAAGAGVEAIAGALTRGEPLDQQFPGLTPLAG